MKSNSSPHRKNRWLKWVVFAGVVAGAIAGWRWYSKRALDQPLDYKTAAIARGDITQVVTANGMINAITNVTVGSQVSGIITDIKVDFNSKVTNGQVIAQIDPSTYQQAITQSEADVASAKAGCELARVNYVRAKALLASALISQADYDTSEANLHQAEAALKMREASLQTARVNLERCVIYAPISGIVITRNVDVGQTVAASFNTPTLFQIANDLHQMRIEAMVSEADVGGVQEGQQVSFGVDAFPGRQFMGKVTQVRFAPITNQNVVNYTTIVSVHNEDLKLRPGMTANASIVTAQQTNVLRIPNAALRFRLPESVANKGQTNRPTGIRATNLTNVAGASTGEGRRSFTPPAGMPVPPWASEGRRPTPEERQKWMDSLTPEQREQMQRIRERMRAQTGDGPPSGFGGAGGGMGGPFGFGRADNGSRASQEGPATHTIYVLDKASPSGKEGNGLKPVTIKTGITDGAYTEVVEGLKEGDSVVTGVNQALGTTATAARPTSPFGGPFGMRPR